MAVSTNTRGWCYTTKIIWEAIFFTVRRIGNIKELQIENCHPACTSKSDWPAVFFSDTVQLMKAKWHNWHLCNNVKELICKNEAQLPLPPHLNTSYLPFLLIARSRRRWVWKRAIRCRWCTWWSRWAWPRWTSREPPWSWWRKLCRWPWAACYNPAGRWGRDLICRTSERRGPFWDWMCADPHSRWWLAMGQRQTRCTLRGAALISGWMWGLTGRPGRWSEGRWPPSCLARKSCRSDLSWWAAPRSLYSYPGPGKSSAGSR